MGIVVAIYIYLIKGISITNYLCVCEKELRLTFRPDPTTFSETHPVASPFHVEMRTVNADPWMMFDL